LVPTGFLKTKLLKKKTNLVSHRYPPRRGYSLKQTKSLQKKENQKTESIGTGKRQKLQAYAFLEQISGVVWRFVSLQVRNTYGILRSSPTNFRPMDGQSRCPHIESCVIKKIGRKTLAFLH
jgi:hypothetical protein